MNPRWKNPNPSFNQGGHIISDSINCDFILNLDFLSYSGKFIVNEFNFLRGMNVMLNDDPHMLRDLHPLERAKLRIEYERIKIDRYKTKWTAISILIPIFATITTICFGIYNFANQARKDFEIKAVEIVMNSPSPQVALNKAYVLVEMFPDRLPANFVQSLEQLYGSNSVPERSK